MKISKTHFIIRWAYLPDRILQDKEKPFVIPEQTDLCSIFWSSVLGVPIQLFLMGFLLLIFSAIIIMISPFLLIGFLFEKTKKPKWAEIISTKISDFKNKTCTRIEIE